MTADGVVVKLLQDAADELRAVGIGIFEMDLGAGILWVGDRERSSQFVGVRVSISSDYYFVLSLEALMEWSGQPDNPSAGDVFVQAFQGLLKMGQDSVTLEYDNENEVWVGEFIRECNGRKDLVKRVQSALAHPLSIQIPDSEDNVSIR